MNEILFRGKTIDTDDWAVGSLVYYPSENQNYIVEHCDEEFSFPVDAETIGQYTGLFDRLGNKIFEGDIVKSNSGFIFEVSFIKEKAACYAVCHSTKSKCYLHNVVTKHGCEVIGKIHDNPEILEV